jgi:hypothetical protein
MHPAIERSEKGTGSKRWLPASLFTAVYTRNLGRGLYMEKQPPFMESGAMKAEAR